MSRSVGGRALIHVSEAGDRATITIDNPEARNALGDGWWQDFAAALETIRERPGIRTIVLTGAGDTFSAGGDVQRMRDAVTHIEGGRLRADFLDDERRRLRRIQALILDWVTLPAFKVAAVNGPAIGAGLSLALSCDHRVVADSAWFDTGFARLGLPGDCGISYFLPRLVGEPRSRTWLLRPRRVGAAEARDLGIADVVVAAGDLESYIAQACAAVVATLSGLESALLPRQTTVSELAPALEQELIATVRGKATPGHAQALERFRADAQDIRPPETRTRP